MEGNPMHEQGRHGQLQMKTKRTSKLCSPSQQQIPAPLNCTLNDEFALGLKTARPLLVRHAFRMVDPEKACCVRGSCVVARRGIVLAIATARIKVFMQRSSNAKGNKHLHSSSRHTGPQRVSTHHSEDRFLAHSALQELEGNK